MKIEILEKAKQEEKDSLTSQIIGSAIDVHEST